MIAQKQDVVSELDWIFINEVASFMNGRRDFIEYVLELIKIALVL